MNIITPKGSQASSVVSTEQISSSQKTGRSFLSSTGVDRVEKVGNTNPSEKSVKMLLNLVKASLNEGKIDESVFKGANYHDWSQLLEIANESTVTGMAFDAAHKLPKGTLPTGIALKMAEFAREEEKEHARQEKIIGELTEKLAKKDTELIQLKGIGFSMNYPVPQHRYGGDIDVFTRKKGTVTEGYSNTWDMFNQMMLDEGCDVEDYKRKHHKHSEFDYKGVRIENHNYFLNKERMPESRKIDAYLHKNINPRVQVLPNGTKILVPSKEFNTVFMAHHAFQHFVFGGIDIHHLTDWGMQIKNDGFNFPEELKGTKFEKFTYALTNLSHKYLGTKPTAPQDKEYEEKIFKKLIYPQSEEVPMHYNKVQTFAYKVKRLYTKAKFAQEYTGASMVRMFADAGLIKLANPKAIFRKL